MEERGGDKRGGGEVSIIGRMVEKLAGGTLEGTEVAVTGVAVWDCGGICACPWTWACTCSWGKNVVCIPACESTCD